MRKKAGPRIVTARPVKDFNESQAIARLFAQGIVEVDDAFMIAGQLAPPLARTTFDVCTDGVTLFVSVMAWESNAFYGLRDADPAPVGGGNNCVEVLLCPYGDGNGHLQYGAGPREERWFRHHWPYRDERPHLAERPEWEVTWRMEKMGEDLAWFTLFRFPLRGIIGEGYGGALGFNVMRTQLATGESACWSHAGGSGFPDASGAGWLRLIVPYQVNSTPDVSNLPDKVPDKTSSAIKKTTLDSVDRSIGSGYAGLGLHKVCCPTPARPGVQLQITYDWPDEMCGGPYTPDVLRGEMRLLRRYGFRRIYWIDYPFQARPLEEAPDWVGLFPPALAFQRNNLRQTAENFNGEILPVACRLAHEEGLEFFTIMKPYDLWATARRPVSETQFSRYPRTLGGFAATPDPFVAAYPEYAFRRNPAWHTPPGTRHVTSITLYADNAEPLPFAADAVALYRSDDNATYTRIAAHAVEEVVERPRYRWTPAGKVRTAGSERVRAIRFLDVDVAAAYFTIQFPRFSGRSAFGNQPYLLLEVATSAGEVATTRASMARGDFRAAGFEFDAGTEPAGWSDASEGIELRYNMGSEALLGVALGQDLYRVGMMEPGFPEVRRYWLEQYVQRAITAGADGVDVRIAHHHQCAEWLSYLYAEPNLQAFRQQFARAPDACAADFAALRRIRGLGHTQFLRDASALLHAAGKKLEAHVESRMTPPPEHDTFTQIHWDYATWIDDGIVDGVNLKYLGPFSPFVHQQILPRARSRDIPVHVIAALGDPRSLTRTPEYTEEMLAMVDAADLDGLNLYEAWGYLRTTPRGEPFARGCAMSVFERLRRWLLNHERHE